jgi:hypothetical protein
MLLWSTRVCDKLFGLKSIAISFSFRRTDVQRQILFQTNQSLMQQERTQIQQETLAIKSIKSRKASVYSIITAERLNVNNNNNSEIHCLNVKICYCLEKGERNISTTSRFSTSFSFVKNMRVSLVNTDNSVIILDSLKLLLSMHNMK